MQLIHRLQTSHPFDCVFINWKWIFSICCSFQDGSTNVDLNSTEERMLLSTVKDDDVYGTVNMVKGLSDQIDVGKPTIPPTDDEEDVEQKKYWLDVEDLESGHRYSEDDKETIAAEVYEQQGDSSKRDDDNGSDYSDDIINKFGLVEIGFKFELMKNTLIIELIDMGGLPNKTEGGPSLYQLFVKIFNENGRALKKWHSSMFVAKGFPRSQKVEYTDMSAKDIKATAVRIRLYGCERKHRDKLLSESIIGLTSINLHKQTNYKIKLEKRSDIKLISTIEGEIDDDFNSKKVPIKIEEQLGNRQELLLGLGYNLITGRMTVEIVKGIAFRNPVSRDDKLPSTFVKISLCASEGQEIAKSKTTVRPNQANPLFKEKFMFQVPQYQLEEISIIILVYHKRSAHRKELIGWFSVGLHSTHVEERSHWRTMKDCNGKISSQWHQLQDSTDSRHVRPEPE